MRAPLKNVIHVFWLTLSILMVGCFNLTPDYQSPDLNTAVPPTYEQTPVELTLPLIEDQWWQAFNDPKLSRLVDEALQNNWDLKQAAARVLEVRALYIQTRADLFPNIDIDALAERRRFGGGNIERAPTLNNYELSAPATFEIDLWSKLTSQTRAAWLDLLTEEENRRTIAQSVVAETISLYLQTEFFERRLQIAYQTVDTFERSLEFVNIRYRRGLTSELDVRQARRVLAEAQGLIPEIKQDLGTTQQQLAILIGRYPTTDPPRQQPDDYYKQLPPVPPGMPSELLLRRPDIRAAENRLKALNERVGAAIADRFPAITILGNYGWRNDEFNNLFDHISNIWNLTGTVTQPIFDAGRLKARQRAAEARFQQGVADYANTVLAAFSEVEGALLTRKRQLERRQWVNDFLSEARATQRVAQNRYIRGLVDYLDVLDAQRTRFQAEDDLVQVDLTLLTNRVSLYRALGGNWADPGMVPVRDDGIFFKF